MTIHDLDAFQLPFGKETLRVYSRSGGVHSGEPPARPVNAQWFYDAGGEEYSLGLEANAGDDRSEIHRRVRADYQGRLLKAFPGGLLVLLDEAIRILEPDPLEGGARRNAVGIVDAVIDRAGTHADTRSVVNALREARMQVGVVPPFDPAQGLQALRKIRSERGG